MLPLAYYSRSDVQEAILELAKDREVSVMFQNGSFGKRPDVLQFRGDVLELAKQGASSFHISEERWISPLDIVTGMTRKQLDDLRRGWDLVLDIDTPVWEYAKITANLLVEALKFFDIKSISVKFSGNKGLHIAIPFEAFPDEIDGVKTKNRFPEGLRVIAAFLQEKVREHLVARILEKDDLDEVCKKAGKKKEEVLKNGKFEPFSVVEIDTVLISSRHLFRSAYSLHEKSGLVSLPIKPDTIMGFEKDMAKPENVKTDVRFLWREDVEKGEAKKLVIQAFDWDAKNKKREDVKEAFEKKTPFQLPSEAVKEEYFPPCIQKILAGNLEDGRKRSLFVLLNFLKKVGWDNKAIEKKVFEWNNKNAPLRTGYVQSQLNWFFKQKELIPPPNCDNKNYYQDLRLCDGNQFCLKFKNPVNFALRRAAAVVKNKSK